MVLWTGDAKERQAIFDNEFYLPESSKGSAAQIKFHVLLTSYERLTKDKNFLAVRFCNLSLRTPEFRVPRSAINCLA